MRSPCVTAFLLGVLFGCGEAPTQPPQETTEAPDIRAQPAAPLAKGWLRVKTPAGTKDLFSLFGRSADLYAVGEGGVILRASNEKEAQAVRPILQQAPKEDLFAIGGNPSALLIVGAQGRLLRSLDNGQTWQQESLPTKANLRAVLATKDGALWVTGETQEAFRSNDNGQTWKSIFLPKPLAAQSIWESETGALYISCPRGTIFRSDNGEAWQEIPLPKTPQSLLGITGLSDKEIFVVGQSGFLAKSTDLGKTFKKLTLETKSDLHAILKTSSGALYIVGAKGTILRSTNKGKSWQKQKSNTEENLTHITEGQDGALFVVGYNGLVLSSTDGDTWQAQESATKLALLGVAATPKSVLAVGFDGVIIQHKDNAWTPLTNAEQPTLLGVSGGDSDLFVVGERGEARRLTAGTSVEPLPELSPGLGTLQTVFVERERILFGGGAKVLFSSTKASWKSARLAPCSRLVQVFIQRETLYAACEDAIHQSKDQGESWQKLPFTPTSKVAALYGNPGGLYAAGEKGMLWRSTDQGASWRELRAPVEEDLVALWANDKEVYAASRGKIFQTNDGDTWKTIEVGAPSPITSLAGTKTHLFVAGEEAMLLAKPFPL